jgi:hypothetical protein
VHRAAKAVRHDPNFLSRVITGDESWLLMPLSIISSISLTNVVLLGYVLDDQGIVVQFLVRARNIVFLQKRRDGLWYPNRLSFSGYQGVLSLGKTSGE